MYFARSLALALVLLTLTSITASASEPESRYFYHGDGMIFIASANGKASFKGRFRRSNGTYDEAAMRRINKVFGATYGSPISTISPRLIEYLDYLQDRMNKTGRITIASGYRSPQYNTKLRENGKLAAKASLHQYGMAADLSISGVPSMTLWQEVKDEGVGGAGFYHGSLTHVDVGPARSWDETTSGVGTDISEENKLIGIVADKDIYLPGETLDLRFIRMTAFPIGVAPKFFLERKDESGSWKKAADFSPSFSAAAEGSCPKLGDIGQMLGIKWKLPDNLKAGRYRARAEFCEKQYEPMPPDAATPEFEVRAR